MEFSIKLLNEFAICVCFEEKFSETINRAVHFLADRVRNNPPEGLEDISPAYAALGLYFSPGKWPDMEGFAQWLKGQLNDFRENEIRESAVFEIPVKYDGADLEPASEYLGMSSSALVDLHCSTAYRVFMIGFLPGFPYLGFLPPALEIPRKSQPLLRVPAGSVAIAGRQTGIYPFSSPGGWHLIGRTERRLFDAHRLVRPALLRPGDFVRFIPI